MKHNVILHVAQLLKSITCIFTISTVFCYDNTNNRFCIVWRYFSVLSMKFPTKSNCMVLYSSMIYKCTCRLLNFIFIKLNYKQRLYTKLKTTIFFFTCLCFAYMYVLVWQTFRILKCYIFFHTNLVLVIFYLTISFFHSFFLSIFWFDCYLFHACFISPL